MATTTPDRTLPATADRRRARRIAIVVAVVLVALGALWLVFGTSVTWHGWANTAQEKDSRAAIVAEQDPGIVRVLLDTMRDASKSEKARIACGEILVHEKNRVADVERLLTDPELETRRIALRVLSREAYFQTQYVSDPAYGVEKTMVEWITNPDAKRREDALSIATIVWPMPRAGEPPTIPAGVLDAIAKTLEGADAREAGLRASAARILKAYGACAHLPRLLAAARAEPEPEPRQAEMEAVVDLSEGDCAKQVPEADVRALVESNLGRGGDSDRERSLRMRVVSILGSHPAWAAPHVEGIRATLASAAEAERRTAFEALLALKDPATTEEFSRWFHDGYAGIRSAAAEAVVHGYGGLVPADHVSLLVGFVRDEPVRLAVETGRLQETLVWLRQKAGAWVGAPERMRTAGAFVASDVRSFLEPLLTKGEAQGVTRVAFADAWWRWMAKRYDVASDDDLAKAVATRDAFWAAANRSDVAAAKAALASSSVKDPRVFEYERGWLASRSR